MIRDNHYHSLKDHITKLLSGLSRYKEELPEELSDKISEEFYEAALESLEKQKMKLEEREKEYQNAVKKFHQEYETVRKTWKNDVLKVRRRVKGRAALEVLGITWLK